VVQAAVEAIIPNRPFILRQIQPEQSAAFGEIGTGWVGVYRWCGQSVARRAANAGADPLFGSYDLLLIHLDVDVAGHSYADGSIAGEPDDLPCALPCPPASDSTDALRAVLLRWFGQNPQAPNVVLCTPSKSTEAWVLTALFPNDVAVPVIECHPDALSRFGVQPAKVRLKKTVRDYENARPKMTAAWSRLIKTLSEASRFQVEFETAVAFFP
jgi:hypothetical protein